MNFRTFLLGSVASSYVDLARVMDIALRSGGALLGTTAPAYQYPTIHSREVY